MTGPFKSEKEAVAAAEGGWYQMIRVDELEGYEALITASQRAAEDWRVLSAFLERFGFKGLVADRFHADAQAIEDALTRLQTIQRDSST
jgi:hypothetical protein